MIYFKEEKLLIFLVCFGCCFGVLSVKEHLSLSKSWQSELVMFGNILQETSPWEYLCLNYFTKYYNILWTTRWHSKTVFFPYKYEKIMTVDQVNHLYPSNLLTFTGQPAFLIRGNLGDLKILWKTILPNRKPYGFMSNFYSSLCVLNDFTFVGCAKGSYIQVK